MRKDIENELIKYGMEVNLLNKSELARRMNCSRQTIDAKLKKVKVPDSVTLIRKDVFGTKKKGMKVEMPSYLKKTYRFNGLNYNYIAKATVFSNGKTKDYKAEKITKIKPFKKSVFVKKGKKGRTPCAPGAKHPAFYPVCILFSADLPYRAIFPLSLPLIT